MLQVTCLHRTQEQISDNVVDFAPSPQPQSAPTYAEPTPTAPESAASSGSNEDWDEIPF